MNRTTGPTSSTTALGVIASLIASGLFAAIFLLAGLISGWGSEEIFGWRIILTLATLAPVLFLLPWGRAQLRALVTELRTHPWRIPLGLLASVIVGLQLWVFMWAPINGMAVSVSLGYFLLPLVMVLVGRYVFGERLSRAQKIAVGCAAVGVACKFVFSDGLAWPTLLVCLGYPVYFVMRRWARLDSLAAFAVELLVLLPAGVYFVLTGAHGLGGPSLVSLGFLSTASIGFLGALAMFLFLGASRMLPLSLFGLMGYVEPVLLLLVALLLGERIIAADALTYLPVVAALLVLAVDGYRSARRLPRISKEGPRPA